VLTFLVTGVSGAGKSIMARRLSLPYEGCEFRI
jgi:hypothetical protein